MIIKNNLLAYNLFNKSKINNAKKSKTTERLSSGYRINRAADNAAKLSISEKMRGQIRGLEQACANIQDSISYCHVADGAMQEAHNVMQRMRELAVQSLNDTNTKADRAAAQEEFDGLQSNLDEIFNYTELNGQRVFEEHEDSYYSITGNVKWRQDQLHTLSTVPSENNKLIIKLKDTYVPSDITIEIPEGIYTTHELIDEIEDRLSQVEIEPPASLILEYTKDGLCNLNLEGADGLEGVDGGLTYLLYGGEIGGGGGKIIGTTTFNADWPLLVKSGVNDEFSFQTYNVQDGTYSPKYTVKLPAGKYTRNQIIDTVNDQLSAQASSHGSFAVPRVEEYGSSNVALTAGYELVVGLSGNMFEIDEGVKYHSIFYDNRDTGTVSDNPAFFTGASYLSSRTENISIKGGVNDTLSISVDSGPNVEVTIPSKQYSSISDLKSALQTAINSTSLAGKLNVGISTKYTYLNGIYDNYSYLTLSTTSEGKESKIRFDTTGKYGDAYNSLFRNTTITLPANKINASSSPAYLLGGKKLNVSSSSPVVINSSNNRIVLNTSVGNYTLNLTEKSYTSVSDIISEIQAQINNNAGIKDKITVSQNSGRLSFVSADPSITSIELGTSSAYETLLRGYGESQNTVNKSAVGTENWIEGDTAPTSRTPAKLTISPGTHAMKITSSNSTFAITVNGSLKQIQMDTGNYSSLAAIAQEMNSKFDDANIGVIVTASGGSLTFTTKEEGSGASLQVTTTGNPALCEIMGKYVGHTEAYSYHASSTPAKIDGIAFKSTDNRLQGGKVKITDGTGETLKNNDFSFSFNGTSFSISIAAGEYDYSSLQSLLQNEIDTTFGSGKINVTVGSGGVDLVATSSGNFNSVGGGFYKYVVSFTDTIKGNPGNTDGTHIVKPAYLIGRSDIANNTVEITAGQTDELMLDFEIPSGKYHLSMTLDAGTYTGEQLVKQIQAKMDAELAKNGLQKGMIKATIGGHNSGVSGAIDRYALNFTFTEPSGYTAAEGTYIIDSVSGSAAYGVFYKSLGTPHATYIVGTENISNGVDIVDGKTTFGITVDGTDVEIELDKGHYTSTELIALLDQKFAEKSAAVKSTITPDGFLRLYYDEIGAHTLSNVTGTARGTIFYKELGRNDTLNLDFQIGANSSHGMRMDKSNMSTSLLRVNSCTLSGRKYAEKALGRLDSGLDMLSKERSRFAALCNRLEHALAGNANTSENMAASESRIRDADMAAEIVREAKYNALSQIQNELASKINRQQADGIIKLLQ